MRCKNCGKDIDEFEIFCNDCKKELRATSSKQEVNELERLIEDQNELNKLEETKELDNLSELLKQELIQEEDVVKESIENTEEIQTTRVEKFDDQKPKKSRKTLIIVLSIVGVLVIALIVILLLLFGNKSKEKVKEDKINYEVVINEYGKSLENIIKKYLSDKKEIPNWQQVTELNNYNKYEVVCNTHNIYKDGSIYLSDCKVNDKRVKYSYGEEKEEEKDGMKLDIYKVNYTDEFYNYSNKKETNSSLVGTITCKTDKCDYITAYNKYVIVNENNENYLYNYENDTMEFGPFNLSDNYEFENILSKDYTLYGIYFSEDGVNNIYNVDTGKVLKNIKGTLYNYDFSNPAAIFYSYHYAPLNNKDKVDFINLKTGNVSYSISGSLGRFIEDKSSKIIYMLVYEDDSNNFKIYNSNGKLLFDGKKFKSFVVNEEGIFVATNTNYKVYDSKLNLKLTSKTYDEVLDIYDDFIVVIDNKKLEILDLNDKVLATFDIEWDKDRYYFHEMQSGWYEENGKNGIYLFVEDKTISYGNMGSGLQYYYIPDTKEIGVIETIGVR